MISAFGEIKRLCIGMRFFLRWEFYLMGLNFCLITYVLIQ